MKKIVLNVEFSVLNMPISGVKHLQKSFETLMVQIKLISA